MYIWIYAYIYNINVLYIHRTPRDTIWYMYICVYYGHLWFGDFQMNKRWGRSVEKKTMWWKVILSTRLCLKIDINILVKLTKQAECITLLIYNVVIVVIIANLRQYDDLFLDRICGTRNNPIIIILHLLWFSGTEYFWM